MIEIGKEFNITKIGKARLHFPEMSLYGGRTPDIFTAIKNSISNLDSRPYQSFHFASAAVIVDCARSADLLSTISRGLIFCDSRPMQLYLAMTRKSEEKFRQSRGTDFLRFCWEKSTEEMKHFLIVPNQETFDRLESAFYEFGSQGEVSGYLVPPITEDMKSVASDAVVLIKKTGANLVWIGIGAPKQIVLADLISSMIPVVTVSIGGAMEILAGQRKEAPIILQRLSLEWIYRWAQEPKRLLHRYTIVNFRFSLLVIRDVFKSMLRKVQK